MLYDDLVQPGEYICHHGVKGQKWGVRRYQNPDGSLTEAGKQRYISKVKKLRESTHKVKSYKQSKQLSDKRAEIYSKIVGQDNVHKLKEKNEAYDNANKAWWNKVESVVNKHLQNKTNILNYAKEAGYTNAESNNLLNIFGTNNVSTIKSYILENMAESGDDGLFDLKAMGIYDKNLTNMYDAKEQAWSQVLSEEKRLAQIVFGPSATVMDSIDIGHVLSRTN